ncbi:AraC family transcriptional regulator [uncultured Chitinophaga sp.]|jgi:AraC-type DNA-binding domain-containing proteins|uniref:helix-turn-helix domain-containing protein n=1 Tax=uncultured Chitinophaga sp. TaxID=339340 RepID=UPI0026145858|nr:response regulator transcription factor [uncultured Chitinophaga sp.]
MHPTETIQQFYARIGKSDAERLSLNNAGSGHFNVYPREVCKGTFYGRRDFYKISLIIGSGKLHYADTWMELDKPFLLFSNPRIPYSFEIISAEQKGWYCLFTEAFLRPSDPETLQHSPLFHNNGVPAFFVDEHQLEYLSYIFREMMTEMESDYAHKFDLLRNYLHLLIHQAMKMQPTGKGENPMTASARITHQFLDLLERQFPIDTTETELRLKTANDFAEKLSVHVNHLNRALKEVTGKTTTEHISARIIQEAMALLRHSDWNIAQIAYGLGFEYPAYFNIFFKKHTGHTPMEARNTSLV